MQLHLSPRHLRLTAAIHEYAARKILAIEGIADIIAAHVVLISDEAAKPKDRFCVKVHLAVAGPDIHAEERSDDLYAALDGVSGKLTRQLRKRHTARIDKRRQQAQRAREKLRRGL
jgi:putative sigma-54 modulation protein